MKKMIWLAALLAGCAGSPTKPFSYRVPPPPPAAEAQAKPAEAPVELTLEQAFGLMEELHPAFAEARAAVEAARGREDQAGRLPNPELIGRVESVPFEGSTGSEAEYLVGVAQSLPVGGRLGAASGAAERERQAAERRFEGRRNELRKDLESAFGSLLYMQEVLEARREALGIARRGLATARARVDAGDATSGETARADLEVQKELFEERRAASVWRRAQRELATAIGKPDLRIPSVEGDLERAMGQAELQDLLDRLDGDALVSASRLDVEAARERLAMEEAARIPDVNLELFYRRIGPTDSNAFDAGLGLSIPLFDGNSGNIRTARAEVAGAEARSRTVRNDRELRIRSAHDRLITATLNVTAFQLYNLPRVEAIVRVVEARYAEGDASLSEVLPVRRERIEVRLSYLEAWRETREAWAELRPFLSER